MSSPLRNQISSEFNTSKLDSPILSNNSANIKPPIQDQMTALAPGDKRDHPDESLISSIDKVSESSRSVSSKHGSEQVESRGRSGEDTGQATSFSAETSQHWSSQNPIDFQDEESRHNFGLNFRIFVMEEAIREENLRERAVDDVIKNAGSKYSPVQIPIYRAIGKAEREMQILHEEARHAFSQPPLATLETNTVVMPEEVSVSAHQQENEEIAKAVRRRIQAQELRKKIEAEEESEEESEKGSELPALVREYDEQLKQRMACDKEIEETEIRHIQKSFDARFNERADRNEVRGRNFTDEKRFLILPSVPVHVGLHMKLPRMKLLEAGKKKNTADAATATANDLVSENEPGGQTVSFPATAAAKNVVLKNKSQETPGSLPKAATRAVGSEKKSENGQQVALPILQIMTQNLNLGDRKLEVQISKSPATTVTNEAASNEKELLDESLVMTAAKNAVSKKEPDEEIPSFPTKATTTNKLILKRKELEQQTPDSTATTFTAIVKNAVSTKESEE